LVRPSSFIAVSSADSSTKLNTSEPETTTAGVPNGDTLVEPEERLEQACDDPQSASEHFTAGIDETLEDSEVDYTLKILHHAKRLQYQGWDIYYRASW